MHAPRCGDNSAVEYGEGRLHPIIKYLPVKSIHLAVDTEIPFEVFIQIQGAGAAADYKRLLKENQIYDRNIQGYLEAECIFEVFIREKDEESYLRYLGHLIHGSLKTETLSEARKMRLLYDCALDILRKIDREEPNTTNLRLALKYLENFLLHLYIGEVSLEGLLHSFYKEYGLLTHCVQTALLGMLFCKFLGWDRKMIRDFGMGALLHDIGKRSIQRLIQDKLAVEETKRMELLNKHPGVAYRQLIKAEVLSETQLRIVASHHEAFDGSGFPDGLKGTQIHEYARIVRIINVFDNLSTRKLSDKPPLSASMAIQVMYDEMGGTFDPNFLNAFSSFMGFQRKSVEGKEGLVRIQLGDELVLTPSSQEFRIKSPLVGMVPDEFFIVRLPEGEQAQKNFFDKESIIVRHVCEGVIYGFRSVILAQYAKPCRLLVLSSPATAERLDLRKHTRLKCFIPSELRLRGLLYQGAILDLSSGGCKFGLRDTERGQISVTAKGEDVVVHTRFVGEEKLESLTGKLRSIRVQDGKYELGIKFEGLSPQSLEALDKFIEKMLWIVE